MLKRLHLSLAGLLLVFGGHSEVQSTDSGSLAETVTIEGLDQQKEAYAGESFSCATPSASTGGNQINEIEISWTPGSSATSTFVEYGIAGFTPGTGTIVNLTPTFGTHTQSISGLSPQTTYEFCVYDVCTNGDTSAASCIIDSTLACPSAGADSTASVCFANSSVNLVTYLNGADNLSGMFVDTSNSGGLNKGDFLPSQVGPGVYHLFYMTGGMGCPTDTAWITLEVDTVPNPGLSASDTICDTLSTADLSLYLGTGFDVGGTWVDVGGTGALSGEVFNPSQVTSGSTYTFRYLVDGNSCTSGDSATIEIFVDSCTTDVGEKEYTSGIIEVYPNPSTGIFYVENLGNGSQDMTVEVYSNRGERVMYGKYDGSARAKLDLSGFVTGLYHIRVKTDDHVEEHRVMKK